MQATYSELMAMKLTPRYEILRSMTVEQLESVYNEVQIAIKPLEKQQKRILWSVDKANEEELAILTSLKKLNDFSGRLNNEIAALKYG